MDETMQSPHSEPQGYDISRPLGPLNQWIEDRDAWKVDQPATAFLAEEIAVAPAAGPACMTAWTDGATIHVNPEWSRSLDETTRHFVQAHLIWHCAAGHLSQSSAQDERRWHLACDHQVNIQLLMLGFELPPTAVLFPAHIGQPLVQVYDSLADNPLLKDEESLDAPPWHASRSGANAPSFTGTTLGKQMQNHWRKKVFQLVRTHLGGTELPASVASWLIAQWAS